MEIQVEEKTLKKQEGVVVAPPSASSSPSHEFSFTISLHSDNKSVAGNDKSKSSFAMDLSPADEIFFHGHLLPLHLLSHLPVSPRSSINSLDSFTLPIKELFDEDDDDGKNIRESNNGGNRANDKDGEGHSTKGRNKQSSFSLFGWRRGFEDEDKDKKKKIRFDVTQVLKRYVRMVRPLLSSFKGRRENLEFNRQAYSFSGNNLSWRKNRRDLRGRRGEHSAPASMRTSPTNSGLLVATTPLPSTSDSTMEELHAAIQAAIAHCKNSRNPAEDNKIKC